MTEGIDSNDFAGFALVDWGQTLSRTPVTKTTDFAGNETLTDGTPVNITAVFVRRRTEWSQDKDGLKENADAYIMYTTTTTVNKDDKITEGGEIYRVINVIERGAPGQTAIYKYSSLVLI